MTKHNVKLTLCLADFKYPQQMLDIFKAMEVAVHAIKAKGGIVRQISLDSTPNKETNPAGIFGDIEFEILLPFDAYDVTLNCWFIYQKGFLPGEGTSYPAAELRCIYEKHDTAPL